MSDPILINQIIQTEGLTGKKAELRRKELESKSNGELQKLLSNTDKQVILNDNIYEEMGWKTTLKINPKYTEPQAEAMGFMHDMLKSASETLAEQDKKDNWISKGLVNFPKEVFNTKYAKSNVQAAIDSTKEDFNKIEDSARKVPSEFEETFQKLRGVKFDEKKIADCSKKAKAMAEFQASTDTIDALKSQLGAALVNTSGNNVSRSGEKAILKTLSTMGYTKIGEVIQAAMKGHENDPEIKDYMKKDGKFAVKKDKKGEIGIYRETENGWQPITQKQAQIIGKEIELRLNKLHSKILGVEIPENASSDDIAKLNETKLEEHRADYEKSFSQAYGKKDLKELSENYMLSQEKGQAYVQMGVNMLAMAGAMFSGGGTLALVSTGVMLSNPVGLIQMATDADGMTVKDWKAYGEGALEQAGWMALGMGAGKVGDLTRSFVKVKGLSKVIKDSGKSFDDFLKIAAKSPDISPKLASSLKSVSRLANTAGVTTEVAADMAATIALQKDGATEMDWAMSIGGALVGTKMQKVLAPMSKDAKVKHIMDTFKDFKIDEKEANHLLKAMQDAESGAAPVSKTKESSTPSPAKISGADADDIQAPRSVKSDKKDFMHKILSLKDEKCNQIISEFTAQKLIEAYGEENVPHLTKLFDEMKSKYGDEEFAGKLFAAYTTNNTTVKSKDFDFVRQFMDEFKDTPENRESLVELVSSMNDKNKQAAKILLDMSKKEPSTKDYWSSIKDLADVVPQFSQTKTLAALKRAQQLKDFDGKNLFSVRDVSIISGETDLLNSKLFDDTEIMKMYYVGPELGNQKYVMKILSAKENADLLAQVKEVLKNDVQKSEDFSKFFKGLMAIKPKISEKMIPLMINDIQDKTVKSFVKRNIDKLKTNDLKRQFITDMTSKAGDLSNVNDKYILSQINRRIDCIIDFMSSNNDYTSFYDEVTNLVNIDKGLRGIDVDSTSNASEYLKYMEENNPQKAEIFKDLVEKYPTMSADEFEEYSFKLAFDKKLPYLVLEEEFLNTIPNYIKDKKIQDLKAYFRDNFQDEMNLNISESQRKASRRLYNDKYLSTLPENTRAMCEKIHDSFGVKMFLCDENDDTSLHLIYNELLEWQKASRGKAELPAVLDLSLIRTRYIDEVFSAGGFCTGQDLVSIRGNYLNSIKHAIRHEIAHANDETVNIKSGDLTYYDKDWKEQHINIDDIIVHKKETKVDDNNKIVIDVLRNDNGTPVPDLDKCKYVEEFRNAGIPTYQINYAYTNKAEFVAVAAEGDYSKYSPEFKELLVNLGLPKWMFKMKNKTEVAETPFNVYKNEKFSDKYTFEENKAISANSEKMFNLVAKKQSSVHSDYFDFQLLGYNISARLDSRVKDFNGINEKIYRELNRLDEKIADVSDIYAYNAKKLKKGDEPLTQEMADAMIEKYNIEKQNLIYNYDTVHDTLQDTFGARLVMDDTSPQAIAKVHKTLLDNIDSGKFKILEINNYQGAGGIPYFSSAQIKQIQAHCRRKGYEVNIVSDVNAPKGKEAEYKNAFNSEKAVKSSGYTTFQMNIEHPSGVISEFQIRGKHLNELAESEHIFYDISQNKNLDKGNFAIKQITDPLIKVVEEMNLPENKAVKEAYSQYLTECYKFARMQELGIPMKKPELPKIVNPMLDIDNIISIHSQIQNLS